MALAVSLLGACTHRIEAPDRPIRIEMTVVLKHEFHGLEIDQADELSPHPGARS